MNKTECNKIKGDLAMERNPSVKWNDQEINNPVLRALVPVLAGIFVVPFIVISMMVMLMAVVVTLPLQPLFWLFNRRGFIQATPAGGISYTIDRTIFKRRESQQDDL